MIKLGTPLLIILASTLLTGLLFGSWTIIDKPKPLRVTAQAETDPVASRGDAADDPAIWVHPTRAEYSLIIGTDKDTPGLGVYGLDGRQIQFVRMTGVNNVDLRDGFALEGGPVSLVVASNPVGNAIELFRVDTGTRQLERLAASHNKSSTKFLGICMYRSSKSGKYYAISVGSKGEVEQWEIANGESGNNLVLRRVRSLLTGGHSEGCVADDTAGALYVSEEERGIWRFGAEPDSGNIGKLIDSTKVPDAHLVADVEGLAIYDAGGGKGYLLASVQGSDRFAVYDRVSNVYLGTFKIVGDQVDGVTNTDGIEVTARNLGSVFPKGLLVVHDGQNFDSYFVRRRQNFKLIRWDTVAERFKPTLKIHD